MQVHNKRPMGIRLTKAVLFAVVFYLLCYAVSFFCRDDIDTYTRAMMGELHSAQKIDMLICGASHVSHGLYPARIKELSGISAICTGTPSQPMDGTKQLLRETLVFHPEVKRVFIECDFAVAHKDVNWIKRSPGKGFFLVYNYLKVPSIKIDYLLHAISPAYYLNYLLPIGKESLLDLNPQRVWRTGRAKINGSYWKGVPRIKDGIYAGGGCVIDETTVGNALSSDVVSPIDVKGIGNTWKGAVKDMVQLCKSKGVEVAFFSNPSTDYYLTEKGNYDEYLSFLKEYISSLGVKYYDFSLLKEDVCKFTNDDFFDDNHLNRSGIEKFTSLFCDFIRMIDDSPLDRSAMFYDTFSQKTSAQKPCVYGLMLDEADDKKSIAIFPVMNREDTSGVTYQVVAQSNDKTVPLPVAGNESNKSWVSVKYPPRTTGKLVIEYYLHGEKQGVVTEQYTAL